MVRKFSMKMAIILKTVQKTKRANNISHVVMLLLILLPIKLSGLTQIHLIDDRRDLILYDSVRKSILNSLDSGAIPKIILDSSKSSYIRYEHLYSHSSGLHSDIIFKLDPYYWARLKSLLQSFVDSASYYQISDLESNCISNFHCFRWSINRRIKYEELENWCNNSIRILDTTDNEIGKHILNGTYSTKVKFYPTHKNGEQAFIFYSNGTCDIYYRKSKFDSFHYIETGKYEFSKRYLIIETVRFSSWKCTHDFIYFKSNIFGYNYQKTMMNDKVVELNYQPMGHLKKTKVKISRKATN